MKPQNDKIHNLIIMGLLLESLEKKCHSNITPMRSHAIYYKKKSDDFSQVLSHIVS
jgi:hypothetical protein